MMIPHQFDVVGCGSPKQRAERGPYQQVCSGKPFYLLDPRPEDIDINDIAGSLSKQCRFMGHCLRFYSVAQHCVMVSRIVAPQYRLWGLLHDAAEAYTGDITRPLKIAMNQRAPGMLARINEDIERAIAARFSIPWEHVLEAHTEIKRADNIALATEKLALMVDGECDWGQMPEPLEGPPLKPWSPRRAANEFVTRFNAITLGAAA